MTTWRIGVDVGGTKIAAGLVDRAGHARHLTRVPTPATDGPEAICTAISDIISDLRARADPADSVSGVGISTGGVVDHTRGRIVSATGLLADWAGTEVARVVSAACGLPVSVDNDGNALALGESALGAGAGYADALFIAVGTGIGGGIVLDGTLRRGAHHSAGELGHIPVRDAEGRACSCGSDGHLEAVAAGPAITRDYRRRSGNTEVNDLQTVGQLAARGDEDACAAIEHGARTLGAATAGLANSLDPQVIIFGGGVPEIGERFWGPVREAFIAEALPAVKPTPVLPAALGPHAAVIGAALLAAETACAPASIQPKE